MGKDCGAADEIRKEMEEFMKSIIENDTTTDIIKATCFQIQEMPSKITGSLVEITFNEYEDSIYPIQITPPKSEVSSHILIIMHDGFPSEAKSTKLGNIKLNLKKLCILSCESIFPMAAATHMPWLIPFAALVVFNKFWSLQNITLTERDAAVIWTMWKNRDPKDYIKAEIILDLVNDELSSYTRPQMSQEELIIIIKNLERMKCIERTKENKWLLLEEVRVTY